MRKLSQINEGLWDGIVDRGTTGRVRKEDAGRFTRIIRKLDDQEFVDFGLNSGNLWGTINFGSDELTKPGLWMSTGDIWELEDALKDTGYAVPTYADWMEMFRKINDEGCTRLETPDHKRVFAAKFMNWKSAGKPDVVIYFPNFGYISQYTVKMGDAEKPVGTRKDDAIFYGFYNEDRSEGEWNYGGYAKMKLGSSKMKGVGGKWYNIYIKAAEGNKFEDPYITDKFQIRLIKKHK